MQGSSKFWRFARFGFFAVALAAGGAASASDLDPSTGSLKPGGPDSILIGFEDAAALATYGVALTKTQGGGGGYGGALAFVDSGGTAMTADEMTAHLAPDAAVEGTHALLLGKGPADGATGILVPFEKVAPGIKKPQVVVSVWVRSFGTTPSLVATYGTAAHPTPGTFTSVTAIRTGRETSDGWAEISTGPIDTAVWGVPLAQLTVGMSRAGNHGNADATLAIDALEVLPLDGSPVAAKACTIATQQAACGDDGECQFGHCLPGYASWGPTPTQAHRADLIDRWISIAKHIHGAANVAKNADAMVSARDALTAASVGGRQFHAGMIGLVNGLRNHHTSIGSSPNAGVLQPLVAGAGSSTLGACLGLGELDLLEDSADGQKLLGFIVYQAAKTSLVGATLHPGDAITKIDGIDPVTWVRSVYLTYATGVPSDPGADLAWAAPSVAWMISHRASTVDVTQCASATDCTGAKRTVAQIDVAGPVWKSIQGTGLVGDENDPNLMQCSERFLDTVAPGAQTGQGDTVTTGTVFGDILGVQFDGTNQDFAVWEKQVVPAFSTAELPTKVLFDVRQGNGGYAEDSELIAEEIRDKSQPIGDVGFAVASWDGSDTVPGLLAVLATASPSCDQMSEVTMQSSPCDLVVEDYFLGDYFAQTSFLEGLASPSTPVTAFTPGGLGARVAWLQAADVSANDYLAALVQGRANQRVFAPGPTSGSYGTISSISPMLLGWRGGSIQMTDSLWGTDVAALQNTTFRSGVGVSPDEVVAETMSDAMNGTDTMITAAKTWLDAGVPVVVPPLAGSNIP